MAALYPSTGAATIVFPPPPPTTNTLTPTQRAHLRKSTKKLAQILGATPQLIDTDIISMLGPVHIQLPSGGRSGSLSSLSSRPSTADSCSSSHWSSYYPTIPYSRGSSPERKPLSRKASVPSLRSSKLANLKSFNYQIPVFQIPASPTPSFSSLSTTSSSPSSSPTLSDRSTSFSSKRSLSRSNSAVDSDSSDNMHFTLRPERFSASSITSASSKSSSDESSFQNSNQMSSTARRQKFNRVKKMLGDDVPIHLIFPEDKENHDEKKLKSFTRSGRVVYKVVRPATPHPSGVSGFDIPYSQRNNGKISSTRDSMGILSPHRAPKKLEKKEKMTKRTTRSILSSPLPPLPPLPPTMDSAPIPTPIPLPISEAQGHQPLCSIAESPDEHGTTNISAEFEDSVLDGLAVNVALMESRLENGIAGKSFVAGDLEGEQSANVESERCTATEVGEMSGAMKIWNQRRGYSGWDVTINNMVIEKTEQERKRSMSYRKPPPPIDF